MQCRHFMRLYELPLHECNLGSPLREIRTAGSARGDRLKRPQPQDLSLPTNGLRLQFPRLTIGDPAFARFTHAHAFKRQFPQFNFPLHALGFFEIAGIERLADERAVKRTDNPDRTSTLEVRRILMGA